MAALSALTGVEAGSCLRKKESAEYAMKGPPAAAAGAVPTASEPAGAAGGASAVGAGEAVEVAAPA
jgi:hypothetical protein